MISGSWLSSGSSSADDMHDSSSAEDIAVRIFAAEAQLEGARRSDRIIVVNCHFQKTWDKFGESKKKWGQGVKMRRRCAQNSLYSL